MEVSILGCAVCEGDCGLQKVPSLLRVTWHPSAAAKVDINLTEMQTKFVKETTTTTTTTQTVSSNGAVTRKVHTATSVRLVERDIQKQQELIPAVSSELLLDTDEGDENDSPEFVSSEVPHDSELVLPVLKNIGMTSVDITDPSLPNVAETPYDPLAMTTLGLPLSFVKDFIIESGGSDAFQNLTTTDVCQKLVQPLTAHTRRSMIDTLIIEGRGDVVSEAKWFVSHAWKYQFLDVIDALTDFAAKKAIPSEEFIIWFDLFSNSQHETANKPFEWWENTFMSAIKKMGQVVMVLIPWSEPVPLTRAWCIFEIYSTVKTGSVFDVAMPSSDQAGFIGALRHNPRAFYDVISRFQSRNAEATNPVDKDRIFQVIAETVGFNTLDSMVLDVFREWAESLMSWMVDYLTEIKAESKGTLLLQWSLASLYRLNGKLALAFDLHHSVYQTRLKMLGPDHLDTLVSMNNMIECALESPDTSKMKNEMDYVALMEECLATAKRALGIDHIFTLLAMYNMASIYLEQGKLDKSEAVLSECLEWRMKILGTLDPETLRTMERLATVYARMNMTGKAESFYLRTIELFEDQYGSNHVDGLTYSTSLVNLYRDSKQTEKAIKLCEEITPKYRSLLGDANSTTQESMKTLAELYNDVGEYDKASSLFQDILASVAKGDGIDTRTSLSVMSYLADTLQSQGQLEESIEMHKDCWARTRTLLGDNHQDTIASVHAIGVSYYYLGKYEESLPYLLESCEKKKVLLGKTHEDTLTGMNVTGVILSKLERYEEAEKILLECLEGRRETLGADNPSTLITMNVLGSVYIEMDRPQEALQVLVEVYNGRMRLFGQENPATITTMALLSQALDKMPKKQEEENTEDVVLDKYDQGMELYQDGKREDGVELMKQYLAENPEEFENDEQGHLGRFTTTGIILAQIGNLDESESMLTEAVRLWRNVIERETMENLHPSFLNCFNSLGSVKSSLGKRAEEEGDRETAAIKYAESEALFTEAHEGRRKLLGEDAQATMDSANGIRNAQVDLLLLSDPQDLESKFLKVTKLFNLGSLQADDLIDGLVAESQSLPESDLLAIRIQMLHADILMQDFEKNSPFTASEIFESCIALLDGSVGETHPLTLEALEKAGQIYMRVQFYDEADEKFAPLLKRTAIVHGEESEEAKRVLRLLNTSRMGVMAMAKILPRLAQNGVTESLTKD
ncbi:Kinesin light chain 3 [Chytriomyces hyalinus]|nr:Kinesin light chain 3 [Chytriomyces hyalinus]